MSHLANLSSRQKEGPLAGVQFKAESAAVKAAREKLEAARETKERKEHTRNYKVEEEEFLKGFQEAQETSERPTFSPNVMNKSLDPEDFYKAIIANQYDRIREYLKQGFDTTRIYDVKIFNPETKQKNLTQRFSPLYLAITKNDLELVTAFLQNPYATKIYPSVKYQQFDGQSLIDVARTQLANPAEMVKLLKRYELEFGENEKIGRTLNEAENIPSLLKSANQEELAKYFQAFEKNPTHTASLFWLSYMYEQGLGVAKNISKAYSLLLKASRLPTVYFPLYRKLAAIYAKRFDTYEESNEKLYRKPLKIAENLTLAREYITKLVKEDDNIGRKLSVIDFLIEKGYFNPFMSAANGADFNTFLANNESKYPTIGHLYGDYLNKVYPYEQFYPLHLAIWKNDLPAVNALIIAGVNLNAVPPQKQMKNLNGHYEKIKSMTPLQLALYKNHSDIAKLLINNGADVNKVIIGGLVSPLELALLNGDLDVVELMFEKGVNVIQHQYPQHELDPIISVVFEGKKKFYPLFKKHGYNVEELSKRFKNAERNGRWTSYTILIPQLQAEGKFPPKNVIGYPLKGGKKTRRQARQPRKTRKH